MPYLLKQSFSLELIAATIIITSCTGIVSKGPSHGPGHAAPGSGHQENKKIHTFHRDLDLKPVRKECME